METTTAVWSFALAVGLLTVTPGLNTALILRTAALGSRREAAGVVLGMESLFTDGMIVIATLEFLEDSGRVWHLRPGILDGQTATATIAHIRSEVASALE
jgi:hypothetical protein